MKLTLRQVRQLIIGLIFVVLAGGIGYWFGQRDVFVSSSFPPVKIEKKSAQAKNVNLDLFWGVWAKLEESYLNRRDLDYQKMVEGAISGMVASLGDPYTVFLPPKANEDAKSDLRGDFEGVGIQIGYSKDQILAVVAPLSGTPAEEAGVKAGDLILRIVDEEKGLDRDTRGISLPQAVEDIRGPKGSTVTLTMQREGVEKPYEVKLRRDTIVVKSVEARLEERNNKKVAILELSRFGERTYQEWQEAVEEIKKQSSAKNFAGVILDLRNNPGGFLDGAVFISSEFLSSGVVVQQESASGHKETRSVNRKGQLLKEPLVVLVNKGSASASEIVAGTLKEAGRVKLVGEKSFGKGTVQEALDLKDGAGLHVTVARWLLPSGKTIDKEGVSPDFEVKMDEQDATKDPQLEKAIELLVH
ncbi:MAG: S41 family peptidase [Patescibacteria group bacterium]|jgi:carboxyl-terminal processing protease